MFIAEISVTIVRGVYDTAPTDMSLSHHCRNHATSRGVTTTPALVAKAPPCNE
jgi:hypothetical protein